MQVEDSAQGRITRWAMNRNTNTHHAMRIRVLSLLAALMLALGVLPAALAEDGQYGYVNFDNVRFRKQANDTVVWDKLNNGWVCKILGTKSAGGVNYYYVSTNLPAYLDREYYGYISQQYITLMSEAEADAWQKQGGNATVLGGSTSSSGDSGTDTANNVTALTNYARPNNASTNYYHYEGGVLTSLGLLSAGEAYYVTGTATINSTIYYIITVNGADCYVRGSNMTMLSSDTTTAPAPTTAPSGGNDPVGTIVITPEGNTNLRKSAAILDNNSIAKLPQGTELPYYYTVQSGGSTWYYCYSADNNAFGYIIATCATVKSTAGTTTTLPTTTNDPSSILGYVKMNVKGRTNIRSQAKAGTGNRVGYAEEGQVLPYYAVKIVSGATWYYVYSSTEDVFGYVLGTCCFKSDASGNPIAAAPTAPNVTAAPSGAQGYIKTTDSVNVRKSASITSARIAKLDKGVVAPYSAAVSVGGTTWYKIVYNFETGYVMGDYCTPCDAYGNTSTKPQNVTSGYLMTTRDKVYLRRAASASAGVYGQVPAQGTVLQIVGKARYANGYYWYNVAYNGDIGYMRGDCISVMSPEQVSAYLSGKPMPTATPTPTPVPKATKYIQTTLDKVWLRQSPSSKAGTIGQAALGAVFKFDSKVKVSGVEWYKLTVGGNECYIRGNCAKVMNDAEYRDYLNNQPTAKPTATPTAVPDLSKLSTTFITTKEKVVVRAEGNPSARQVGLIYTQGTGGKISGATNVVDGVTWYGVTISGVTGWIRGDLVRILTKTEEAEYIKSGDPDSKPEASYTTLQLGSTGEAVRKVQVRLAELGYMSNSQINSVFDSNTASAISRYQEDHDLVVDGIATSLTQHSLFGTREKSETTNGSSTTVTLHMPKLIDWYTGGIQSIFYKGSTAVVTDVNTGISFRVKRWSGGAHADVEPLIAADTAAMCKIYKVKTAQEISDKNLYQRHPVLVTIGDNSYAASMYGVPHNYPAGDTIPDNDFYGQFCIHFVNSKTHGSGIVDVGNSKNGWYGHQDAIMDAYRNAAKKLNIKN